MKEDIKIVAFIFGIIIGAIGILVGVFYLIGWMFPDESDIQPYENFDAKKCRELGGFPIQSKWDGTLKECKKFELK